MKRVLAVLLVCFASSLVALADSPHASVVLVKTNHHRVQRHHAHKATKHHAPKRRRHAA